MGKGRTSRKVRYTGKDFLAACGVIVETNDAYSMYNWADILMVGYQTLMTRISVNKIEHKMSPQDAFNAAVIWKKTRNSLTSDEAIVTYFGKPFISQNGAKVKAGESHKLKKFLKKVGLNRNTYISRVRKCKDFSKAISVQKHAPRERLVAKPRDTHAKRIECLFERRRAGRVAKCKPCNSRHICYVESRA